MSHLVESIAYANETPWHNLGVQVEDTISTEDMLIKAGLNWTVDKEPMMTQQTKQPIPEQYALVRNTDQRVLGTCGRMYKPVQNKDILSFFHDFVTSGGMKMETAGSLDDGRHIFALASIQESFELAGGNGKDKVDGYLLFSSPHFCGKSLNILFTPIRVVCNNTLTMALSSANGGKGQFRMHHARDFNADEAKLALGLAKGQLEEFRAEAQFLAERKVELEQLREYFSRIWPTSKALEASNDNDNGMSRTAEAAMVIFNAQPGANLHPDTWWNAFNTVTYIVDHISGRSDNNRLRKAWFGNGKQLKQNALRLATDYARAA